MLPYKHQTYDLLILVIVGPGRVSELSVFEGYLSCSATSLSDQDPGQKFRFSTEDSLCAFEISYILSNLNILLLCLPYINLPKTWFFKIYRSGLFQSRNSKSFVDKDFLRNKWKCELTMHFKHEIIGKHFTETLNKVELRIKRVRINCARPVQYT